MKKNLPFIITMSLFVIACTFITIYTIDNEPQYVLVSPREAVDRDVPVPQEAKININTASAEELQTLSGIGEVLAGRIIAYREEVGDFLYVTEIMQVSGIGEVMFERIKGYIYVD